LTTQNLVLSDFSGQAWKKAYFGDGCQRTVSDMGVIARKNASDYEKFGLKKPVITRAFRGCEEDLTTN